MRCVIRDPKFQRIELDFLRDMCFVDVDIFATSDTMSFMLRNDILYILLQNNWIDTSTFSYDNVIFNSLDHSDLLALKHIVSEALKWPEIWYYD